MFESCSVHSLMFLLRMKELIKSQMMAALATLKQCIENCADSEWQESHNDAPFSQVLFHALIYTDLYLSKDVPEFKAQQFHIDNKNIFRDYEELEYKEPVELYTKEEIKLYFDFCGNKIDEYFSKLETGNLMEESSHLGKMKNAELLIYITRHIQHHAAQLGLRLEQIGGKEQKWIKSGGA